MILTNESPVNSGRFIAVIQVATWRDYVDDLSPGFVLSEEDALTKSIPRTTVTERRAITSLTSKLGLGLERSSTTKSDTKTTKTNEKTGAKNEDSSEITSTEIRSRDPGESPEFAENSATLPGSFADQSKDISKDPILHYTAATALYQEVKMLNRYVKDAALRSKTIPYIVRVQLQVLPYARNQPYDVYTLLSFFGSGVADKIRVVPLLVTDNLENALAERTSQTIRDITLALSTLNSGLLGTFGLGHKTVSA